MSSINLVNVYEFLLKKYCDDFKVIYKKAPSYLTKLTGSEECRDKIIFFCKEDRNCLENHFLSPTNLLNNKPSTRTDALDLTGSPLKDDCIVDAIGDLSLDLKITDETPWLPAEIYQRGIDPQKVRLIICSEEFQTGSHIEKAHGSVWFLCNGSDFSKSLMLQFEFDPEYFSRGVITYQGIIAPNTINCLTLLRSHYSLITEGSRLETNIENCYNIKSNITIRCSWSTNASHPSLTDLSTCDVTLTQKFAFNQTGSLTQDFMNQLNILKIIRDDIIMYKENTLDDVTKEVVYRCGCGIDMEDLRDDISRAITEISGFAEIDNGTANEIEIEAVLHRAKLRRLTDLTDKLWEILKRCSSYKDLKLAFNILFQCAARCNIVNTPTNKNRLAEIITEIANHRLAIPCLTGTEPLELLLEIGLEKLYKDYEYIFTESQICSANQLKCVRCKVDKQLNEKSSVPALRKSLRNAVAGDNTIARKTLLHNTKGMNSKSKDDDIGFRNSHFDEFETEQSIVHLLQIHYTLEHLLMMNINLNLTNVNVDACEQLFKRPLPKIDCMVDNFIDEMTISISVHEVHDILEGKDPHSRCITMKSKNKYSSVKSTFYFSMQSVLPPGISQCFYNEDKEIAKDNVYYHWNYRKIKSLK